MSANDHEVLQAIRRSHCDRKNQDHKCIGTVSITPSGIELACDLCGKGGDDDALPDRCDGAERLRAILRAAGLDYDKLAPKVQLAALKELRSDLCPGCTRVRTVEGFTRANYYTCPCGGWVHSGYAWRKTDA